MTSDNAAPWMASMSGRHPVDLGPSLLRALKARSGAATKQAKNKIPVIDFYSFRYKFKPESVDDARPGQLEAKSGSENAFRLERPSTQHEESHVFSGTVQPARDWECVLILDEETGAFTLEKLDSSMDLTYEGRSAAKGSRGPSSLELHKEDDTGIEDAEGESDVEAVVGTSQMSTLITHDTTLPIVNGETSTISKSKASKSSTTKGKTKSKPRGSSKLTRERAKKVIEDVEQSPGEDLTFDLLSRQSLRARSSGTSSNMRRKSPPPLALPTNVPPRPSDILVPPPVVQQPFTSRYEGSSDGSMFQSDSDDSDMEAVQPPTLEVEEEVEEEVDADAFALELDQNLMTDEETPVAENDTYSNEIRSGPVSLNQYAGGEQDDDDYSSSEDSDD